MTQESGWSQANLRDYRYFTDDHDRRWGATTEKRSGGAVGKYKLLHRTPKGARVPWEPDQAFLIPKGDRLFIDYEGMLRARLEAHEEYFTRCVEEATSRSWQIPEKGEPIEKKLKLIVGEPPKPIEPIVAAMQGNSWILGKTDKVDARLVSFLPQRQSRQKAILANLPDLSDASREDLSDLMETDEELEARLDIEEQVDPQHSGGQTVPTPQIRRKRQRNVA